MVYAIEDVKRKMASDDKNVQAPSAVAARLEAVHRAVCRGVVRPLNLWLGTRAGLTRAGLLAAAAEAERAAAELRALAK